MKKPKNYLNAKAVRRAVKRAEERLARPSLLVPVLIAGAGLSMIAGGLISGGISLPSLTQTERFQNPSLDPHAYQRIEMEISQQEIAQFRALESGDQLKQVRDMGEEKGPETVRAFLGKVFPDEPADAHELAHVVGESGYRKYGYAGFGICDSFMRYACYHGVTLRAIQENGYNESVMSSLAGGCTDLPRHPTAVTACIHGIGHGLMWIKSYDLAASFEECEKMFDDATHQFFCYDGVAMENVVRRGDNADLETGPVSEEDPFAPCNAVASQYEAACVREHVHYVRTFLYEKDTDKTEAYCLHFEQEHTRRECFSSIGSAVNQDFGSDPEKVIAECGLLQGEYRMYCIGTAATQYAYARQAEKARLVCGSLQNDQERAGCLGSVQYAEGALF